MTAMNLRVWKLIATPIRAWTAIRIILALAKRIKIWAKAHYVYFFIPALKSWAIKIKDVSTK